MPAAKGTIVLMGSGELTATMVEVHKNLLGHLGNNPRAAFLDTPAGFQLNADQISLKAVEYFRKHIQQALGIASYKSQRNISGYEAEQAFHLLRKSDYILIGPGSPTYAVRQWQISPVPEILTQRIKGGGCLVAASAAALTVGRFTLPVYEIYKVGQELHWIEGMDILGKFGFNLVVIPHWNNAEGGTHDTRFCFMGESRFRELENLLPQDVSVLGLDEHTACIINLESDSVAIKGIGRVCLRRAETETLFETGDHFSLELLRGGVAPGSLKQIKPKKQTPPKAFQSQADSFWEKIHFLEDNFHIGLENKDPKKSTNVLLELDRMIWQAHQDSENEEFVIQARDILRELIASLGAELADSSRNRTDYLTPLIEALIGLRQQFREKKQWQDADAVRNILKRVNILLEDTEKGPRWRLES